MQSTQEHITGRNTFDNQNVKNSSKFYNTYDSLVDKCLCKFCQDVQFDFQQCQTRLHSQPVEYYLDTDYSGKISNTTTENQFINDLFDPADIFRTNFITPEPAIAFSNTKSCNEVESSNSSEKYAQNYYQNYDPVEQCQDQTDENAEIYIENPKAHSVALLDDRAITISFGSEPLIRYAILNLVGPVTYRPHDSGGFPIFKTIRQNTHGRKVNLSPNSGQYHSQNIATAFNQ